MGVPRFAFGGKFSKLRLAESQVWESMTKSTKELTLMDLEFRLI
jgi:hypothetical protein